MIKKDIKNLHLAVYPPDGRVRLAIPQHIDDETARIHIIGKLSWIKKQIQAFQDQPRQTPRQYISGESHYFLGQRYRLNVIEHTGANNVVIRKKKFLDLYTRVGSTIEQRERIIQEWYRQTLKSLLPELIEKWEQVIPVNVSEWGIKKMRTKWGTCKIEEARIWLNLELAKKPVRCIEYILVHEMTHLLVRHHNDAFRAYLDSFMPNWRSVRDELNGMVL